MAYVLPQVLVFQELRDAVVTGIRRRNAFFAGGHAHLVRYSEPQEKGQGFLGIYDHVGQLVEGDFKRCYPWPNKPAGSRIDTSYTRLFIDDALLRYFYDTSHMAERTGRNKVRHPTKAFKSNPDNPLFPRSAEFLDRDVQVGDVVVISALARPSGSMSSLYGEESRVKLCTYVRAIEPDMLPAGIGTAIPDPSNFPSQTYSTSHSAGSSNSGQATISSVNGSAYDGHPTGDLSETYVITVIQSSTGGNASTARLRVVSASGRDDQASVVPAAFGMPTNIGTRGLQVVWSATSTQFVAGDYWTVTVNQAFTAPTALSAGSYTAAEDRVYEVTIVRGGSLASGTTQIRAVSTDGTDYSGPTTIPHAGASVPVGTKGVTIAFAGTHVRKGDRYVIGAIASKPGAYHTLVLGHDLDPDIAYLDPVASEIEISLYIKRNIEVPQVNQLDPLRFNWEQEETEFCVMAGLVAFDPSWTSGGIQQPLPIITDDTCANTNRMYVHYRAWRSDLTTKLFSVGSPGMLNQMVSGPIHPDNPLKYALSLALGTANGEPLYFSAVADPNDVSTWNDAIRVIEDQPNIYNLVPLTFNKHVQNLFAGHVHGQSKPEIGRWRAAWFALKNEVATAILSKSRTTDGTEALAVVEDDPESSGTQYTYMRITSGNASFVAAGVRPGDQVRYRYSGVDILGRETYQTYVVDSVLNETTLRLVSGTEIAEPVPKKFEIWRSRTIQEQADYLAGEAASWGSDRIVAVWPDSFLVGDYRLPGYFLAGMLAAQSSGVLPHQSLTRVSVSGIVSVTEGNPSFGRHQLDGMAEKGVWIVTQDPITGEIYTRHALTTAGYGNPETQEESVRRNRDSVSYYFLDRFAEFIGNSNVSDSLVSALHTEALLGLDFLRRASFTPRLGGQIVDGAVLEVRRSLEFADRMVVNLEIVWPYPLNNLEVHLQSATVLTVIV